MTFGWLDRRPVLATVLTALGVTMLAAGLVGLLAPLNVLDGLWQLGDPRLMLALAGFFVASLAAAGIAFAQKAIAPVAEDAAEDPTEDEAADEDAGGEETPGGDEPPAGAGKDKPRFFT